MTMIIQYPARINKQHGISFGSTLMVVGKGLGDVFKILYDMCHLFEVAVFCLIAHAPYSAKRSTSANYKYIIRCHLVRFCNLIAR